MWGEMIFCRYCNHGMIYISALVVVLLNSRPLAGQQDPPVPSANSVTQVVFTSILLGGRRISGASNPEVDHRDGSLFVQFSPVVSPGAGGLACRYRLDGLEDSFTTASLHEVRYSGLLPGHYELVVQCRMGDSSHWASNPATFAFTVLAPWWQKWYTRVGEVLLVGLLISAIVGLRTRALNRRRLELEVAIAERGAELVEINRQLLQKNKELEEIALTDSLTGTRNRRYFYETMPSEASRALRAHRVLAEPPCPSELIFVMVDIDSFKQVNDAYGHAAGDRLLAELARRLSAEVRQADCLVRWGGEEFLIVCRTTQRQFVPIFCERLLRAVSDAPFDLGGGIQVVKTCSFGWAPYPWVREHATALPVEAVLELADKALYLAKASGRNRAIGALPSEDIKRYPDRLVGQTIHGLPDSAIQLVTTVLSSTSGSAG